MSRPCEPTRCYRCYADPSAWTATGVALSREEWHHLRRVLRVKVGDKVTVFDGQGREAQAYLSENAEGQLLVAGAPKISPAPACTLVLIQALPKSRGMDSIVEKATELGVSVIYPVVTDRAITRPDPAKRTACLARWQRIAVNAARQCGVAWVPQVHPVASFEAALTAVRQADAVFIGCTDPGCASLRSAVDKVGLRSGSLGLMIGPEGDWTDDEVAQAVVAGARPVSFGTRILRVETAALYGLSVLGAHVL